MSTMALVKAFIIVLLAAVVASEPPVPGYNYQAPQYRPSNNYQPPNTGYNSQSYLPPTTFGSNSGNGYDQGSSGHSNFGHTGSSFGHGNSGYDHSQGHDHGHGHGHDNEVPKSYEFGYSVKDAQSGNDYGRRESSDGNVVRGEYRVQLPDGRTQIVTYHADWKTGFHADVRYEGEARYPEPSAGNNGYNYKAPDYSGSLSGLPNTASYRPRPSYGPPGYQ